MTDADSRNAKGGGQCRSGKGSVRDLFPSDDPVCLVSPLDTALRQNRDLPVLLGCRICCFWGLRPGRPAVWIGWGYKSSGQRAMRMARRMSMPFWLLEDGFIRSVSFGPKEKAFSLVRDDEGIYYDATGPSRLEGLICNELNVAEKQRAENLISLWCSSRVSKYNHSREYQGSLPARYVLAVDQTRGDSSIRYGLASESSFKTMLESALDENPGCKVLLKLHPEVISGKKRAHFDAFELGRNDRLQIVAEDVHPPDLIENSEAVYTVTSQVGFEALLWNKPVRTFGMPFYAGWGLTKDELPAPRRRKSVPFLNVVHAALVSYAQYSHPETGLRCGPEPLVEWMGFQRKMRERLPRRVLACGFARWKRGAFKKFFPGSSIEFCDELRRKDGVGTVAWASKFRRDDLESGHGILNVEDGFIRSVGLGAQLVQPLSWVIDAEGIYYDARQPSGLERLLQTFSFEPDLIGRAIALRKKIVELELTKYNVGTTGWSRPQGDRPVFLAVGQVETDASLRYGTTKLRTNMDFLRAVRSAHPQAYLVYKPHPDVVAGLRLKGDGESLADVVADEIVTDCSLPRLFDQVDEVHVLTSLTGFEALLRGKTVATYGQPFYSGWGLTNDNGLSTEVAARRSRRPSLDELVAATLILYPVYLSRRSQGFTSPERVLDELFEWRLNGTPKPTLLDCLNRIIGRLFAN